MDTARQPAGIPAGGQFAATAHPEAEVSLAGGQATLGRDETAEFVRGEIFHHIAPVISALRMNARNGVSDTDKALLNDWRESAGRAAETIAEKVTVAAPVLDGFTAEQLEDQMAYDTHEDLCGCLLVGGVCSTPSYGPEWRWRMGVPNVQGMFDTLEKMAAAREAAVSGDQPHTGKT